MNYIYIFFISCIFFNNTILIKQRKNFCDANENRIKLDVTEVYQVLIIKSYRLIKFIICSGLVDMIALLDYVKYYYY